MKKEKPQEYQLQLYNGDKHGRIESVHRWTFVIRPELKVVRVEMLDEEMKVVKKVRLKQKEREVALFNIREFLFRKTSTPFAMQQQTVWSLQPAFVALDKKHIQRLYLLEEL